MKRCQPAFAASFVFFFLWVGGMSPMGVKGRWQVKGEAEGE